MKLFNKALLLSVALLASLPASVVRAVDMPHEASEERARSASQELIHAVVAKDIERVTRLLQIPGIDLTTTNTQGQTALNIAGQQAFMDDLFKSEHEEVKPMVRILALLKEHQLKEKATRNACEELLDAAQAGDLTKVAELLATPGIAVNYQDEFKTTALGYACQQGHVAIVQALIEAQADITLGDAEIDYLDNDEDECGIPFLEAADRGHGAVLETLIKAGADIHIKNDDGDRALIVAARAGHIDVVTLLIAHGVNVNKTNRRHETALMESVDKGRLAVAQELIKAGAHVDAQDDECSSALTIAALKGHADIAQELIKAGADLTIEAALSEPSGSALTIAALAGHLDVVRLLLAHQPTLVNNKAELSGETTPLMDLMIWQVDEDKPVDQLAVLEALLVPEVEVNMVNNEGETALMLACKEGKVALVERLLQRYDIDIQLKNNAGQTAREIAQSTKEADALEALFEAYDAACDVMIKPAAKRARIEESDDEQ